MCWSSTASLFFTIVGTIYTIYVYNFSKKYNIVNKISVSFYTLMELTQLVQYYYIGQCTPMNNYLTLFAHFLIWVQPLMSNYFGYIETKKNKEVFAFAMVMSIIVLIVSCIQLFVGEYCKSCDIVNNMINTGNVTCTTMGIIHLQWQFRYASMRGFNTNWLMYGLLIVVPNLYHSESILRRPLHWILPFLLSIIVICDHNNENISLWCAFTIPYATIFVIDELIKIIRNK